MRSCPDVHSTGAPSFNMEYIFLIKNISHDVLPVLSAFSFLRHFHSHSYLNLRLFGKLYSRW